MDLNEYFKTIAIEHVDIQHSDTNERKGYFRSYSSATVLLDNEFHKNLRYVKSNALISQFNDDADVPEPMNDFKRKTCSGTLYILSRIIDADIEAARLKCIEIRDDVVARLRYDYEQVNIPINFVITALQSNSIGRVADNFYCTALLIAFTERYSNQYDSEKWNLVS